MKLILNGEKYDLEAGLARVDLYTLYELKAKYGIGMKSLLKTTAAMKGMDPMDVLEDAEMFYAFLVVIWLARRCAGEQLSLEEATAIPITELQWDGEGAEEQADPPQALTGSVQGGGSGRRISKGTSRTSKSP